MEDTDLTKADSGALRAQYEAGLAQIEKIKNDLEPIKNELVKRENKETLILNAVMNGQQALLRASGVSDSVIAAAEQKFQEMRAEKMARNAAKKEAQ